MPSATGVRIAGDDYQWLYAWRACMEALHEKLTGKTNPVLAVGVEEAGVGNADDVVYHRAQPPNSYVQIKYAVDYRDVVNLTYLETSAVLRKLVSSHRALTADGTSVEMRLLTNRAVDPHDRLLRDRDARGGTLMPRAAQGNSGSERGMARAAWAAVAGIDEPTLLRFLKDFQIEPSYDVERLRMEIGLLMTANGLRSDEASVSAGASWVAQQVIGGHRLLGVGEIKLACDAMGLAFGSPWTTVSIATIKRDELAHQAAVAIDWVDKISGANDWSRVAPTAPNTWDDLADEIRTIPRRLSGNKRILVTGHMRQATGFLVGAELRRVMNYEVGIRQGDQLWTSEEFTSAEILSSTEIPLSAGIDTAVLVNVAADAAQDVIEWIKKSGSPIGKAILLSPASGVGPKSIPTPGAANSLAVGIRDVARRHARGGKVHLFLIGPLGLALLLGHHWNRVTTTHVYEHLGGADYAHAFTVEA